jgi:hypothetical protein
MEMS